VAHSWRRRRGRRPPRRADERRERAGRVRGAPPSPRTVAAVVDSRPMASRVEGRGRRRRPCGEAVPIGRSLLTAGFRREEEEQVAWLADPSRPDGSQAACRSGPAGNGVTRSRVLSQGDQGGRNLSSADPVRAPLDGVECSCPRWKTPPCRESTVRGPAGPPVSYPVRPGGHHGGRSGLHHLVLPDPELSRVHAELRRAGDAGWSPT